jgi:hypothetical protein
MSETEKRKRLKRYFLPPPGWPINAILVGIAAVVVGYLIPSPWIVIVGIGLAALGVVWKLGRFGIPSDEDVDRWMAEDCQNLAARARQKSGFAESQFRHDPIIFIYAVGFRAPSSIFRGRKVGKDKWARTTPNGATVINVTEDQLSVYSCVIDHTTGNKLNETTQEVFYQDVVSVDTRTTSESVNVTNWSKSERQRAEKAGVKVFNNTIQFDGMENVSLRLASGDGISVAFNEPTAIGRRGSGESVNDKALASLRYLIRDMKKRAIDRRAGEAPI